MYVYCQERGIDHVNKMFKYGRNSGRVTVNVSVKTADDFTLMDTPGTNDF